MIDVNMMRAMTIQLNGLQGADESYVFYYDETNNIRKLHITPDGLNVRQPACFVLGGIAHLGPARSLDIRDLRAALRIQPTAKELKIKHLGSGSFLDLMKSRKIMTFLDWLNDADLFIHFQILDVMYWSVVDIVDSILTAVSEPPLFMYASMLKNDLYSVLRRDLDHTVALLKAYDYPDVGRARRHAFVEELITLLDFSRAELSTMQYQMLKGVLQMARDIDALPYLEDEEPGMLIKEFGGFYINRICLFKNAMHFLDVEEVIQTQLSQHDFVDEGRPLENHQFVDSTAVAGIQIADVVVGLLGKAFTYINQTNAKQIAQDRSHLSEIQRNNLSRLTALIDRSIAENAAFSQYILSGTDHDRMSNLFDEF